MESFLLVDFGYRIVDPLEETREPRICTEAWSPAQFARVRQTWLRSLQTHWFHLPDRARLDEDTLNHQFVVLLTSISESVADQIVAELEPRNYYHFSVEVDPASPLHQALYFEVLLPRYSLLGISEAAVLVEAGNPDFRDAWSETFLRRCKFRNIHYEFYLPWDYRVRKRIDA